MFKNKIVGQWCLCVTVTSLNNEWLTDISWSWAASIDGAAYRKRAASPAWADHLHVVNLVDGHLQVQ